MNFFKVLLRPDREEAENAGRAVIAGAANQLQVGEFQFLQLAYREWFGDDIPESAMDGLFDSYMLDGEVPYWARHCARRIIRLDEAGDLNDGDPRYHRYDCEYSVRTPLDVGRICFVLGFVAMMVGGGLAIANFEADPDTSMFPPYFSDAELQPQPANQ
jgi:hypothetical protein